MDNRDRLDAQLVQRVIRRRLARDQVVRRVLHRVRLETQLRDPGVGPVDHDRHLALIVDRQSRDRHTAVTVPDDRLDVRVVTECVRNRHALLRVPGVIHHQQVERPTQNAALGVDLLDGQRRGTDDQLAMDVRVRTGLDGRQPDHDGLRLGRLGLLGFLGLLGLLSRFGLLDFLNRLGLLDNLRRWGGLGATSADNHAQSQNADQYC